MLVMAEYKGKQANLAINWQQGLAEASDVSYTDASHTDVGFPKL